jgi:hypothetical protein
VTVESSVEEGPGLRAATSMRAIRMSCGVVGERGLDLASGQVYSVPEQVSERFARDLINGGRACPEPLDDPPADLRGPMSVESCPELVAPEHRQKKGRRG